MFVQAAGVRFVVDWHNLVLYDQPAATFVQLDRGERERFRQALFLRLGIRVHDCRVHRLSASWTEDEDFDLVINAVRHLRCARPKRSSWAKIPST